MSARARRLGDYAMTEAKQARLREIAQLEQDRELATLAAQKANNPQLRVPKAALLQQEQKTSRHPS